MSERPSDDEVSEIEQERAQRLDPDRRPDNAEVDNTDAELPTVEEFARREAEEKDGDEQGTSDPSERFRAIEVSDEEQAELEEERRRRLDPDNAEVDNTGDRMPEIARDETSPMASQAAPSRARSPARQPSIICAWFQAMAGRSTRATSPSTPGATTTSWV